MALDKLYNQEKAGIFLDTLYADKENGCLLSDIALSDFQVKAFEKPRSWRLVLAQDLEHEASFVLHGVVLRRNLAPITSAPRMPVEKYRFLKQSISLTGCGSAGFNRSRDGLQALTTYLKAGSHEQGHVSVDPTVASGMTPFIEAGNRYFTSRRESSAQDVMEVPQLWDPLGFLNRISGDDLVFTTENMVEFTKAEAHSDGSIEYVPIPPSTIQVGDVVSMEVTHMLVPLVNNEVFKLKAVTVLRAVMLVSSQFTEDAVSQHVQVRERPLKRRLALGNRSSKRARVDDEMDNLGADVDEKMNFNSV